MKSDHEQTEGFRDVAESVLNTHTVIECAELERLQAVDAKMNALLEDLTPEDIDALIEPCDGELAAKAINGALDTFNELERLQALERKIEAFFEWMMVHDSVDIGEEGRIRVEYHKGSDTWTVADTHGYGEFFSGVESCSDAMRKAFEIFKVAEEEDAT